MFVDGQEVHDANLRRLTSALEVGKSMSGVFRHFLFGSKSWDTPFELKRVSDKLGLIQHLGDKKHFNLKEKQEVA